MKEYLVGGAVRDLILGRPVSDYDYVVTGATPTVMIEYGFTQVGSGFPVFLHPTTKDEYALARTESKVGERYQDFDCYFGVDVTIEKDLSRRDLTINSIAIDLESQAYIDPYGGRSDCFNKILRHTSEAFTEDPIRVLRLARFKAQLGSGWVIADETLELITTMQSQGMLKSLTPERIWREMEKAISSPTPSNFFEVLPKLFPEVEALWNTPQKVEHHPEYFVGKHTLLVMDYAAAMGYEPEVVFACLTHDFGKPECWINYGNAHGHELTGLKHINNFCERYKIPTKYKELALMVCEYHTKIHGCLGRGNNSGMRPKSIMKLFEATGALRNTKRFEQVLKACEADAKGRGGDFPNKPYPQKDYIWGCLQAAVKVDTKSISNKMLTEGKQGVLIGQQIRFARINAIREVYNKWNKN